jgi:DNA-binding SARP family transcriptional activator
MGDDETRFGVLGPLEIVRGGRQVLLPAVKQRIVLATLLLHANRPVSVNLLVERVWDGSTEGGNARAAVQAHIGRLRARLQARLIHTHDDGYSVEATADSLDMLRFRDLVARAQRVSDPEEESSLLRQALDLDRGPVLSNVPSASLHDHEASSLAEEQLRVREHWLDVALRLGRHDQVIADAKTLTAEHPLRERFWAQLMLALYRSGRQAEALWAYRSIVDLLREELGVDPGAQGRWPGSPLAPLSPSARRRLCRGTRPHRRARPGSGHRSRRSCPPTCRPSPGADRSCVVFSTC